MGERPQSADAHVGEESQTMTAEQWLSRYLDKKREAFEVQLKIKELRASQILPAPVNAGMPVIAVADIQSAFLSGYAAKLMELEEKYTALWKEAKDIRSEIAVTIRELLPLRKQQELFINRYIMDLGATDNAELLHISRTHFYRLWKAGLSRFEKLCPDLWKMWKT